MEKIFKLCAIATVVYADSMEALAKSLLGKKAEILANFAALRKEFDEALANSKIKEIGQEQAARLDVYNEAMDELLKEAMTALGFKEPTAEDKLVEMKDALSATKAQVAEQTKLAESLQADIKNLEKDLDEEEEKPETRLAMAKDQVSYLERRLAKAKKSLEELVKMAAA